MDGWYKKAAVPEPSAATDVEQPNVTIPSISDSRKESNREFLSRNRMLRMAGTNYLPTIRLEELFEEAFDGRNAIIDGLLYTGTYLLAGAPKVGKSFLVAQMAYHVSAGLSLWEHPVHQSPVLYLALEDDHQRLQRRMAQMFGVDATGELFFSVSAKQLGHGLDEQLDYFLREQPNTKLIIVDTLQKVREAGGDKYSYASDYDIVGRLKRIADSRNLCIMIVHHTRKQQADDKFDMISGTTGLLGCADGAFLLQKEKRTDQSATLDIVGRDQPDQRLHLVRDESSLIWKLDHTETELWEAPADPILEMIGCLMTEHKEWTGTATELIAVLQLSLQPNTLAKHLNVNKGRLLDEYSIRYDSARSHAGRRIELKLLEREA